MHIFLLFLDSDVFSFFFLFLYFKYLYYFVAAATAAVVGSSRRRRLVGKKNQCAAERPFCIAVAHPPTHAKPARLDSVFPRVCRTVLLLLLRYYYYSNYYIGRVLSERIWESHDSIASLSLSLSLAGVYVESFVMWSWQGFLYRTASFSYSLRSFLFPSLSLSRSFVFFHYGYTTYRCYYLLSKFCWSWWSNPRSIFPGRYIYTAERALIDPFHPGGWWNT